MALEKGIIVEGKITGITRFGAFVALPENHVGMIHISQVSATYVTDINQHIKVGDVVKVRVLGEHQPGKYDLSIKQVENPRPVAPKRSFGGGRGKKDNTPTDPFEAKITAFLKQSEEKLLDLKRHVQEKQHKQ